MAVVCNPIRMGRWSELMVVCVWHSDKVMREADAIFVDFKDILEHLHTGMMANVRNIREVSDTFAIINDVKQACVLAPTLLFLPIINAWRDF